MDSVYYSLQKTFLLISLLHSSLLISLMNSRPSLKNEVLTHFTGIYKDPSDFDEVVGVLNTLQEFAQKKYYGDFNIALDQVEANDTIVSISVAQPGISLPLSKFLYEGDVLLSPQQAKDLLQSFLDAQRRVKRSVHWFEDLDEEILRREKRKLYSSRSAKWPQNQPIKYILNSKLSGDAVSKIRAGVKLWEDSTCLRFQELSTGTGSYIEFFMGQGCYSMIGRTGGRQGLSIGKGCESAGVAAHEIGHALGLWHEQSRPDRDCCINLKRDNIIKSTISNFLKRALSEIVLHDTSYDVGSVMHYGPTAFTNDWSKFTIETKNPGQQRTIGQREKLSFFDIMIINKEYYKCPYSLNCYWNGYQHPSKCNVCICPDGIGGNKCSRNEPSHPPGLRCGGQINVGRNWKTIESPGFPSPGYSKDQKCSWLIRAPQGRRVMLEFVDDFSFWCTTTCMDYVEVKNQTDLRQTGMRFCCWKAPKEVIYSEGDTMVVIFRSTVSQDRGFRARVRMYPSDDGSSIRRKGTSSTTPQQISSTGNRKLTYVQIQPPKSPDYTSQVSNSTSTTTAAATTPPQASTTADPASSKIVNPSILPAAVLGAASGGTWTRTTTTTRAPWVRPSTRAPWVRLSTTTTRTRPPTGRRSGTWTGWSRWSVCSKNCGACGIAKRTRTCTVPPCKGSSRQYRQCGFEPCTDDLSCKKLQPGQRCEADEWLKFCVQTKSVQFQCTSHPCCPPFQNLNGYCRLGTRRK